MNIQSSTIHCGSRQAPVYGPISVVRPQAALDYQESFEINYEERDVVRLTPRHSLTMSTPLAATDQQIVLRARTAADNPRKFATSIVMTAVPELFEACQNAPPGDLL